MQVESEIEHQTSSAKLSYMYVPRAIDNMLWDSFMEWWSNPARRVGWISLESDRGQGNTYLLEHFRRQVEDHTSIGPEACVVFADADENEVNDGSPPELPSIARAVFAEHSKVPSPRLHRLKLWFSIPRVTRFLAMFAGVFLVLTISAIIHELGRPLHPFSAEFWTALVRGALEHDIELTKELGIALILAFIPEIWKWGTHEESKKESEAKEKLALKKETYRNNGPGLMEGIKDICRRHAAFVLIVDNAHRLNPTDRALLERFVNYDFANRTDPAGRLRRFKAVVRVIVITLDFPQSTPERFSSITKVLSVQPFTRVELRQILENANPSANTTESSDWLLDLAEQNVKAVYLEQNSKLRRRLEEEFRNPPKVVFKGIFGFRDLMAFCAVRPQPSPTTSDLFDRLDNLELGAFGLKKPQDLQSLVEEFCLKPSLLFHIDGDVIHFDAAACKMLRQSLEKSTEERPYILRAHYYWFVELSRKIELTSVPLHRSFSGEEQINIRQIAWHVKKLGALLSEKPSAERDSEPPEPIEQKSDTTDSAGVTEFLAKTRLNENERLNCQHKAAAALLLSSVFTRSEGEISQARDLIEAALAWIPSGPGAEPGWMSFAVRLLWSSYWISLDIGIRADLDAILHKYPSIATDPSWSVHHQFENVLTGNLTSTDISPDQLTGDPDLLNIWNLTAVVRAIRLSHGFTSDGLRDPSIVIPDPLPAEDAPWAEFALRDLQASAFIFRENWEEAKLGLTTMRDLLKTSSAEVEPVHMQANRLCQSGRYHHLLLEYWKARSNEIENLSTDDQEEKQKEVESWLKEHSRTGAGYSQSVRESLFAQTRIDYRNAMQIATWLSFHSVLLDTGFHLGCLLLAFTPDDAKEHNSSWWNEWERLFQGCIRIEKQSEWQLYSPTIYRLQTEFFGNEDKSAAISDSFNTLQSIRKAGYPHEVVLEWHSRTGTLINDYAQNAEDYKRGAELHEFWAHELAALPQAEKHRVFKKSLLLEQAYTLNFAAQAERQAGNLKRAETLIVEAEQLFRDAVAGEHGEDANAVRDLGIGIRMQRAWIVDNDPARTDEYNGLMHAIWKDIEFGCQHCANMLGCIISIEEEKGLLDAPLPPSDGNTIPVDPENLNFSLPEQWFQEPYALAIHNRFQYRFYQMLRFVSRTPNANVRMLTVLGRYSGWSGQEHFGESVVRVAQIEVANGYLDRPKAPSSHPRSDSANQRYALTCLLEAVANVFLANGNAEYQIRSFRLLMELDPLTDRFRIAYVEVLVKHNEFLERELRVRALERAEWFATARKLDYYFSVLVDKDLVGTKAAEQIRRSGQTMEEFQLTYGQLEHGIPQAKVHFNDGRDSECQAILDPLLNFVPNSWVFILYLEAIDLWLRSATRLNKNVPPARPQIDLYNKRSALLRELSLRYITQFGLTIEDPRIQQLAVQLFETLHDALLGKQNIAGRLPATAS